MRVRAECRIGQIQNRGSKASHGYSLLNQV